MARSRKHSTEVDEKNALGAGLSFAASEAYKLLRTNLLFALPDERKCRVVGITSSDRGEGKSTTSFNLAYTLAQAGKRVLLIEADMRLPSISRRLGMKTTPGLSNLLAGLANGREVMQQVDGDVLLWLIASGDIPPNPSELLSSEQMKVVIQALGETFDFILLDLPPVTAVSDPLVVCRLVTGMIVVVRQNYTNRRALNETMRQLNFAGARIIGFVMTDADSGSSRKKKRYGYGYGYGEDNQKSGKSNA